MNIGINSNNSHTNSISQLSSGEISMLSIALSIIKEWDVFNSGKLDLNKINGCVIVDEVDSGFHLDYCYEIFPKLMKLFPNIQFIITTHSPFLLAGLKEVYKNDIDILYKNCYTLYSSINQGNNLILANCFPKSAIDFDVIIGK